MKLYLTSAYHKRSSLERVRELYELDSHGVHSVVLDPAQADSIVFVENTQFSDMRFKQLNAHPLVLQFPEKVFMYNELDQAWPIWPGLYCSMSSKIANQSQHVAFPYLPVSNTGIKHIYDGNIQPRWLFSFVGSISHPIRKELFTLNHGHSRVVDTSEYCAWNPMQKSKYTFQKLYTDTIAESKFVLCPRGIGPSSMRLFETIEAGRIPVVISDEWVAPPQIDWDFAVRIPESDIASIPDVLTDLEAQWQDRGAAARAAWESAYAPDTLFNTLGDVIQNISRSADQPETSLQVTAYKWRVLMVQAVRYRINPPAGLSDELPGVQLPGSFFDSLMGRLFSR